MIDVPSIMRCRHAHGLWLVKLDYDFSAKSDLIVLCVLPPPRSLLPHIMGIGVHSTPFSMSVEGSPSCGLFSITSAFVDFLKCYLSFWLPFKIEG